MRTFAGADIFDGEILHKDSALIIENGRCVDILSTANIPANCEVVDIGDGTIVPGFVDLQVNGGGGKLFNDDPSVATIQTICDAHRPFGTTALLPTLITDERDKTTAALEAAIKAQKENIDGFLGLHLEGPHLSIAKKGAHRAEFIRPMNDGDLEELVAAKKELNHLLITVAPESVTNDQISELARAGIKVNLGHSAVSSDKAEAAFSVGASGATHLYNAMSPLSHREPGLVGAAVNNPEVHCGLIADGHHVAPYAINVALSMKLKDGKIHLVTDAMSTIGTDLEEFNLNGRKILRKDGRLTLEDGTLAGADLDMITAVKFMADNTCCEKWDAIRIASTFPAEHIGAKNHGHLKTGARADFLLLDAEMNIDNVWLNGSPSS